MVETITAQAWCASVKRLGATELDVVPSDGANHLAELLPLLDGCTIRGVRLQQGRFDELFRNMTQGVAA